MAKPAPFPFKKGKPANSKSVPPFTKKKSTSAPDPDKKAEQRCMTTCMKKANHMTCMKKCMGGSM